jgi:4-hydroxybenzoate polyprenyltransferase
VFALLALAYASIVDFKATLLIAACMASYWIYSLPPYRMKRLPVFSKLVLSLNSILIIVLGFYLVKNEVHRFPKIIYFIYLFCFTIAANLIDLKDIKGDISNGINTLPIIVGEKNAKMMIGFAAFLNSLAYYFLMPSLLNFILFFLSGTILYYVINKEPYHEKNILIVTNLSLILLISYLIK